MKRSARAVSQTQNPSTPAIVRDRERRRGSGSSPNPPRGFADCPSRKSRPAVRRQVGVGTSSSGEQTKIRRVSGVVWSFL